MMTEKRKRTRTKKRRKKIHHHLKRNLRRNLVKELQVIQVAIMNQKKRLQVMEVVAIMSLMSRSKLRRDEKVVAIRKPNMEVTTKAVVKSGVDQKNQAQKSQRRRKRRARIVMIATMKSQKRKNR